ncbi:hypothetical protein ROLI_013490 [Roseobacter fucihabitans]|uniref:Uncharacterized protein n=1 Tax=Roseobacter fucihabitans TaxID=1537242 RepID=A0ABZ2BQK5_9RHOB|nr:hypothetical protein [Roseobacter litoralis]MBC6967028.1 hypothetical protein [Roseobacter litoralis]
MTHNERHVAAAFSTLILLQLIMLSAHYAGIEPHPPVATPLFGIAPFLGASMSIALSTTSMQPLATVTGRTLAMLAATLALVSFGPQKHFDAQFGLIWPAVILGQLAAAVIFFQVIGVIRVGRALHHGKCINIDILQSFQRSGPQSIASDISNPIRQIAHAT